MFLGCKQILFQWAKQKKYLKLKMRQLLRKIDLTEITLQQNLDSTAQAVTFTAYTYTTVRVARKLKLDFCRECQ